jgi:serine/threonine protein kinase
MGCASSSLSATEQSFHDYYLLDVKLGRGAFAQVRAATLVKSKRPNVKEVAVKILDLRGDLSGHTHEELMKKAIRESTCWQSVRDCKHIVQLYDVFYSKEVCYFVMERCARSLLQHMESLTEIDERSIGNTIMQMLNGVAHVHRSGVVHRDIKPNNFMVGDADGTTVKLFDFGVSLRLPQNGKILKGYGGTAPFMCPEMISSEPYDYSADVWSMGVIVYAFLFGEFPYAPQRKKCSAMKKAIVEGNPPKFQAFFSATGLQEERSTAAVFFVRRLLDRDSERRPSADEALKLPYMDAIRSNRHMLETELPCLRSTLQAAKMAGAFDGLDKEMESSMDPVLNTLQLERHGKPLPDVSSEPTECNKMNCSSASATENLKRRHDSFSSLDTTASPSSLPPTRSASDWGELSSAPRVFPPRVSGTSAAENLKRRYDSFSSLNSTASLGSLPPTRSSSDWSEWNSAPHDFPSRNSGISSISLQSACVDSDYRLREKIALERNTRAQL